MKNEILIAISQRSELNKYGVRIDVLESDYIKYLEKLDIRLLPIPNNTDDLEYYFDNFHISGIILSGGEDISPESYGESGKGISPRDIVEKKMLDLAVARKLPVLGICRGMQFINVYFKGRLVKDIKEELGEHPPAKDHPITTLEGEFVVNSYHNQGVSNNTLSPELKAWAICGEIIEALYHPSLPIAGIQWHPERKSPDQEINKRIIQSFIKRELFWKN